jgi:hypothetical protein
VTRRPAAAGSIRRCRARSSAGSPESEQIRDAHSETCEEHVAQRGYNDGSTDCLITGPQHDQSDNRADAGEQVAEADAKCPHAHVGDVVRLYTEEGSHPGGPKKNISRGAAAM